MCLFPFIIFFWKVLPSSSAEPVLNTILRCCKFIFKWHLCDQQKRWWETVYAIEVARKCDQMHLKGASGRTRTQQRIPALSLAPQLGYIKLGVGREGAVQGPDPVKILGLPAIKKNSWNGFARLKWTFKVSKTVVTYVGMLNSAGSWSSWSLVSCSPQNCSKLVSSSWRM